MIISGKNTFSKYYFTILLFYFSSFLLIGQNLDLRFKHLDLDNGLTNSTITSICQDKSGFMWFGSMNGLNRFDGYNIRTYYSKKKDSNSLVGDFVQEIFTDKKQNIWFLTNEGLFKYNPLNDAFTRVKNFSGTNMALDAQILEFNDTIYVVSVVSGKFMKYDEINERLTEIKDNRVYPKIKNIVRFTISSDGVFWNILNNNSVVAIGRKSKNIYKTERVWGISKDEKGNVYIGGVGSYYFYDLLNKEFKEVKFPEKLGDISVVWDIFCTKEFIWFATEEGGLIVYNRKKGTYQQFKNNKYDPGSLSGNSVRSVYIDNQNNLWAGCWKGGVNYVNLNSIKSFENLRHISGKENSLSGNMVTSIYESSDNKLFITLDHSGLNVLDRKTGKIEYFFHQPGNSNSLAASSATFLVEAKKDLFFIAFWGGFSVFDYSTKTIKSYYHNPNDPNSLPNNYYLFLLKTRDGRIILPPHETGIFEYHPKTGSFSNFTDSKKQCRISAFQDSSGDIWFADYLGLYKFDEKGNLLEEFHPTDKNSISNNWTNAVNEDSHGNIWIGTADGLNKYDPKTKTFKVYTIKDGLPSSSIMGILFDDNQNLWLSTLKGISRFDPIKEEFKNYNLLDGVQSNEFNVNAYYKNAKGEMFFGGINGLTYFHPDSIFVNQQVPPIYLTNLSVDYKKVSVGSKDSPLDKHISEAKSLVLTHEQSTISIGYVALNYINSQKNKYAYMLEGLDVDWNYVNDKREASYTKLAPGEYVFKVKACNNDGIWNEEGISLNITILPPWWATWWFKSLLFIIVILMIISFIHWRISSVKERSVELEKIVKVRTSELLELNIVLNKNNEILRDKQAQIEEQANELEMQKEELLAQKINLQGVNENLNKLNVTKDKLFSIIAHDLRSPFNIVLGFSRLLANKIDKLNSGQIKQYANLIQNSAQNVYNLLDNLLIWARAQQQAIHFEPESFILADLINGTIATLNESAKSKSITLKAIIKNSESIYGDKNMLRIVIQNLINNAIKFSFENSIVEILAEKETAHWLIAVKDNGIGIDEKSQAKIFYDNAYSTTGTNDEKGSGLGLVLCKEFIEAHHGKIWFESENGNGTTFYFTIPVIKTDD